MATSKSLPEVKQYPCLGGCGRTLTYRRKQHAGRMAVWCPDCYAERRRQKKRKGGPWFTGAGGKAGAR